MHAGLLMFLLHDLGQVSDETGEIIKLAVDLRESGVCCIHFGHFFLLAWAGGPFTLSDGRDNHKDVTIGGTCGQLHRAP